VLPGAVAPGGNSTAALNATADGPNGTTDPALGNVSSSALPAAGGEAANPTQDEAGAVSEAVNGTGTDGNATNTTGKGDTGEMGRLAFQPAIGSISLFTSCANLLRAMA